MKTRNDVMLELLEAASDALRRKQADDACRIVAAYETLNRCGANASRPAGLDSGEALRDAPGFCTDEQWAKVKQALKGLDVPIVFNETRRTIRVDNGVNS